MLNLWPVLLGTLSTRQILRVTVGVTATASNKYSTWSSMKRKSAQAEPSIPSTPKRRKIQMATRKISLTAQEQRLRDLLLDVARFIDEAKQLQEKIELRWAGGWVRDKLLGIPSDDIDTAINSMTGLAFCEEMKKYVDNPKNIEKHSLEKHDLGNLHTIQANPEKSKHLETTTIRILGFDVDFVNLRKETYTQDSRNPQMEFGTAVEDAVRRDATINALFYNLHSDQVEDFCGGLADLEAKTIKTPLEPLTTFTDDPLRVLRLIRFASRLQFKIDPVTEASMSNPAVNDALKIKISRERVGVELEKMLKGKHPREALHLIDRLGLYSVIFTDPTKDAASSPAVENWKLVYDCLETLQGNKTPGSIYDTLVRSEDAQFVAWILAAVTPWSSVPLPEAKPGAKLLLPYATLVGREGIKVNNKISDIITAAFRNLDEITALRNAIQKKEPYVSERDTLGMMIRRWDWQGKNWRLEVLLAIFVEVLNKAQADYTEIFASWQTFIDHLEGMGLMNAPSIPPKVNGVQLMKALEIKKAGAWMKPALDVCMEWQLRNPDLEDTDGAIEEVKKRKEELKIP
ncbi:Poly A polymerase C-terminal region-like protein [Glarea lozoyensis ATCC 20868]|uniref:Poly A polymerase C-terminal region-like protein n=1 Tax=Glarea lozoyensis (strain ATCC 20868 / MF5171) TaxID=1116229 RepID=S3DDG7_GLAL2|nr:Poly A polymerase C-terminal region-like protein [Glarea lozoyensis ATCC 20868]EPE35760.1 Poly A polymerase C-terminal region-like protein [Glarea lozoyensis ATCC 20868]